MKYTNTSKTQNNASFVQVSPMMAGSQVDFSANSVTPNISGTIVPMVRGYVRLTSKVGYTPCGSECSTQVNEAVRIEFNVVQSLDNLEALRDECVRVMDVAIAEYYLAQGIVPPVSADFASE